MLWKTVSAIMLTLLLTSMLTLAFNIQPAKAASETIIDTHGDGRFTKYPSGPYWWSVADHDVFHTRAYNNNFWYTYCGAPGQGDLYFGTWSASISGEYDVFVWIPNPDPFGGYTPTHSANYQVYHQGGLTEKTVNQALRLGGWYSLGRFTFGASALIILNDRTGEPYLSTMVAFDAIKFVGQEVNNPPYAPFNPSPYNHATSVSITADLSWTGGDPDSGNTVTYDVYFGLSSSPPLVSSGQSATTYNLPTLSYAMTYYWKITSTDNHGSSTPGLLWDFSTEPPPSQPKTLTVYSSPSGVSFTANGVSHSTPWQGTFAKDTSVNLEMDSDYYTAGSRYYWYQWSDGVASMSRTVVMSSDIAVTGTYVGPYYELTITSSAGSPSGIPFTLNGATKTTTYSEWLYQGYYSVEMPAQYNGYVWQHWLEDGDENRIRTVSLTSTSVYLTAVYSAPYGPSLSIPVYAPINQSAHQGTTLAFIFRVSSAGGTTDTINLRTHDQRAWNIWLSEYSVSLEPNQGKDVYLYLTVGGNGNDIITIEGTSEADPSKTSSCEVIANGYGYGYGLFNVELKFSNRGSLSSRLLFNVPAYVKISASEIYLPGPSEASVYVVFDPKSWNIDDEPGLNSFSINVEDRPYGETAVIPVKFDECVIAATDFDLTEDSYSFENGLYEYDTCYGMAATAITHLGTIPPTYDKTKDEAKSNIKWHQGDVWNWLLGMDLLFLIPPNEAAEYTKLKNSINLNVPTILALHPPGWVLHAVVPYKIVESGSKAYILCYDSNEPFSSLSDPQSFTYAIYDTTTQKLLFCVRQRAIFDECEFLVHEPAQHPVVNWYPIKEGYTWAQQVLDAYKQIKGEAGMNPYFNVIIDCPVNVTITDQHGRIVSDNGTNQIPNATVASTNDLIYFCLPLGLNYSVFISAYGSGDFNLMITKPTANSSVSVDIYENISVNSGTQATLEITPHQMNQTMRIDIDGDGVIDELRSPTVSETIYIPIPVLYTFSVVWGEETFIVTVESNSTVSNFAFSQSDTEISFDVSGSADTTGFCNVTIPKSLLWVEDGWTVLIDGELVSATITVNATHSCLYFAYTHSTHQVQIIGTHVIGPPPPPMYTLTITATIGGTTDPAPGTYSYTVNSSVQVTAIPDAYYLFDYWELDDINVGSANPYTALMDQNHTLKAVFAAIPPSLSASISPLSASLLVGQSVTFTSTVSGGVTPYSYQWYLNGAPVSAATSDTWAFTPTTNGIYYVYLKVTDDTGNTTQSETARITVTTVPVGGYSVPIQLPTTAQPATLHIALLTILTAIFITIKRRTKRKH